MEFNYREKYERISKVREWIILQNLIKAITLMNFTFNRKIAERDHAKYVKKCIWKISRKYKNLLKRRGKDN